MIDATEPLVLQIDTSGDTVVEMAHDMDAVEDHPRFGRLLAQYDSMSFGSSSAEGHPLCGCPLTYCL